MKLRKLIAGIAVVGAISLAAGPAFAEDHYWFVAKNPGKGSQRLQGGSDKWTTLTPEIIFGELIGLSGSDYICAVIAWGYYGLPDAIVVSTTAAKGFSSQDPSTWSDGKGLDDLWAVYGDVILAITFSCHFG